MSSMRNAVQRPTHRERAQPASRAKWGILEKPKDYKLRAADFRAKKAKLRSLRQKAADRNPDEFYFGMMSARQDKDGMKVLGKKGDGAKGMSVDEVRLLKTQDAGYLRMEATKARREIDRLKEVLGVQGVVRKGEADGEEEEEEIGKQGKHLVFVDSPEEQRTYTRSGLQQPIGPPAIETDEDTTKQHRQIRLAKLQKRLDAFTTRLEELEAVQRELELQRAKMNKTPAGMSMNKHGVKFKTRVRTGR
ncbi:MAG: hypothetical protein M1817_000328 [Caeruleum heppii]|nr:MAG: hypothetical protein M1817_000328 [Caeruleum heppii]